MPSLLLFQRDLILIKLSHLVAFLTWIAVQCLVLTKTKEIAILDKPKIEFQVSISVCFRGLYVQPFSILRPDLTYKTPLATFVCSRLKLGSDPSTCLLVELSRYITDVQNYHTPHLFKCPAILQFHSPQRLTSCRPFSYWKSKSNQRLIVKSSWLSRTS